MAYVITAACIDVKDASCQQACPVASIYEGGRMMYIHPDECINCGLCLSICPVQAIYKDDSLPESLAVYREANAAFFGPEITGWGSPGGADSKHRSTKDHRLVSAQPTRHS